MNINLTENNYIFQSAKRLLNAELDKCLNLLKETEDKWNEYIDLKLHDIGYGNTDCDFELNEAEIHFTEDYIESCFDDFCNISYDDFIEWCKAETNTNFNELKDEVGRTSSFYLGRLHNNETDKYIVALAEAVDDFNMSSLAFRMEDDKIRPILEINENDDDIEDIVNEMLSLSECLYDNLKYKLDDIVKVYDYIHDFKENQVDSFKDFVQEEWKMNL